MNKTPPPPTSLLTIVTLFAGALVSGALVFQHFHQLHESGLLNALCGGSSTSGCEAVNTSEFSSLLGVPVAAIGLWYYLSLGTILFLARLGNTAVRAAAGRFCFLLLCAGLVADMSLLLVQLFVIKSFCTLCIATYVVTILAIIALRSYRKKGSGSTVAALRDSADGKLFLATWSVIATLLAMAVGAGSMVLAYQDTEKLQARFDEAAIKEYMDSPVLTFDLHGTPVQGAPEAKIQVVIFSDFLCPWCRQVAQSFQQFMPKWKDRIAIYYKDYPLDMFCNPFVKPTIHAGACWAALGGLCAANQGKFWEFHDRIFTIPPKNPGSDDIIKLAGEAGLDTTALSACMHQSEMQRMVRSEIDAAHALGIEGTPRIFVNGRKLPKVTYLYSVLVHEAKKLGIAPLEGINE